MTNSPLVSVLMTVYNREKYLKEAIISVMSSTYTNWELIIVDDRSKDKSIEIARYYEDMDDRIKVYVNDKNLGDYPNRNKAASYAKGKYLKYVDADDMLYPHGLELLVFYMEQFPDAGYGLCSLDQDSSQIYPFELTPEKAYYRHYFESQIFHKAPLSSIIRKDVFFKYGPFSGKRMLGDFEMWHILSQSVNVVLMPKGIAWYRVHEDQEMSLHRSNPLEPFKYVILSKNLLESVACPLNIDDRKRAIKKVKNVEVKSILSSLKHQGFKKFMELLNYSDLSIFDIIRNF